MVLSPYPFCFSAAAAALFPPNRSTTTVRTASLPRRGAWNSASRARRSFMGLLTAGEVGCSARWRRGRKGGISACSLLKGKGGISAARATGEEGVEVDEEDMVAMAAPERWDVLGLGQVHATLPRMILHLHDDDLQVRQACRSTLKQLAPLMEVHGLSMLFSKQDFHFDHRDYKDFVWDLTRQLCQLLPTRVDTYLASVIQAFDAPWPLIQANAIYFSSCMLSLSDDQRSLAPYFSQVLAMLVHRMGKSPDPLVRATCSFALGSLLKASNPLMWSPPLDRVDSSRSSQD